MNRPYQHWPKEHIRKNMQECEEKDLRIKAAMRLIDQPIEDETALLEYNRLFRAGEDNGRVYQALKYELQLRQMAEEE